MTLKALSLAAGRFVPIKVDSVVLALALGLAALVIADAAQAERSALFMVESLWSVAPYLLASIVMAAWTKAAGADQVIARAFQGRLSLMIVLAAFVGGLSPFCSCGVIPLIAALLALGVPLPAVMAFWLASPIMDPSMFVLTSGILGIDFAVAKTIAAVGIGLFGGFGLMAMQGRGLFSRPLRDGVGDGGCAGAKIRNPKEIVWRFWQEPARRQVFAGDARSMTLFLGKWLALAFVLESLMLAYVPDHLVVEAVGAEGWLPVIAATLVGVPAYINGYAALPLVGGLMEQGMAAGPALAFLVAGGVTSIPAAVAVFALARLPVFFAYLGFALSGSLVAGLLYGALA